MQCVQDFMVVGGLGSFDGVRIASEGSKAPLSSTKAYWEEKN